MIRHAGKNPSEIKDEDIKDYLVYLSEGKGAATSTLNQAINALKFYYGTVLLKKFIYEVRRPRKDKKLPVVLSKEEVAKILSSVDNLKHKTILILAYSAGLRVGEVVRLKTEDIDSHRKLIHIKGGFIAGRVTLRTKNGWLTLIQNAKDQGISPVILSWDVLL